MSGLRAFLPAKTNIHRNELECAVSPIKESANTLFDSAGLHEEAAGKSVWKDGYGTK
jgi:hypothetical protein